MRRPPFVRVLRVGRTLERSRANGPGERFVIWVKGCSLRCLGCYNPEFFSAEGGEALSPLGLARRIAAVPDLRGVTLSGGEPLEQPEAVAEFLDRLDRRLDTAVFTGYTREEILSDPRKTAVWDRADLFVCGRFDEESRSEENPWAGSASKRVHARTGRIRADEFPDCRVEVLIAPGGRSVLTGFPPAELKAGLAEGI